MDSGAVGGEEATGVHTIGMKVGLDGRGEGLAGIKGRFTDERNDGQTKTGSSLISSRSKGLR